MTDFIVLAVIVVTLASALVYIIRAKRKGRKCIGCPDSASCMHNCNNKKHLT